MNNKYEIEDEMVYRPNSNEEWCCFDDEDALIDELNKLYKENEALRELLLIKKKNK